MTEIGAQGFEIHPGILPAEAKAVAETLGSLTSRTRAGARHLMGHPAVEALANEPRLLSLAARGLGGGEARPFRATLFDKSPRSNWLVAWHQDTTLPLRKRRKVPGWGPWSVKAGIVYARAPAAALERIVALRVHLDDSLPDNGPLRVLPGTHTAGVLSDEAVRSLAFRVRPLEATCARGGVIVMRPLLVHASSKAATRAPRRVLHIEYARSLLVSDGIELAMA